MAATKARPRKTKRQPGKQDLLELYRVMKEIRLFEEAASQQYMHGRIRGFLHLYIGQEAIAAGTMAVMQPQDYVFTHYRDHGHALARGMDPNVAMAELFGKAAGSSKGKGGSMHLFDPDINFMGGYAIVAGQIPLATGMALANGYKGNDSVVVCFIGDGSLSEGEFHEAVNLASVWKLPIVFLCENNLYGMGAPVKQVFAAADHIYKIVEPYGMPSRRVDGMDVLAVRDAMVDVLDHVRSGKGPYFVEAMAYRFRGHSMADPAEYRHKSEETKWRERDPIDTFRETLLSSKQATAAQLDKIDDEMAGRIDAAVQFAIDSPDPELAARFEDIVA